MAHNDAAKDLIASQPARRFTLPEKEPTNLAALLPENAEEVAENERLIEEYHKLLRAHMLRESAKDSEAEVAS